MLADTVQIRPQDMIQVFLPGTTLVVTWINALGYNQVLRATAAFTINTKARGLFGSWSYNDPYHTYHMCHIWTQNMIDMTSMIATAP
jgi:hypothetical protein